MYQTASSTRYRLETDPSQAATDPWRPTAPMAIIQNFHHEGCGTTNSEVGCRAYWGHFI